MVRASPCIVVRHMPHIPTPTHMVTIPCPAASRTSPHSWSPKTPLVAIFCVVCGCVRHLILPNTSQILVHTASLCQCDRHTQIGVRFGGFSAEVASPSTRVIWTTRPHDPVLVVTSGPEPPLYIISARSYPKIRSKSTSGDLQSTNRRGRVGGR